MPPRPLPRPPRLSRPSRRLRRASCGAVLLVVSAACRTTGRPHAGPAAAAGAAAPSETSAAGWLLGPWDGEDATRLVFARDSSALWIFPARMTTGPSASEAARDTFRLRFAVAPGSVPLRLDLAGFDRGPLRDRVLLCIAEPVAAGARFRMDCEPRRATGPDTRPATFTAQTRTYTRPRAAP